ncbi:UDP-Glycosyltransferase superfamily protein [Striga asiatica]|uniref:UDP-Glycosyltransferase superfamily protein n=1 Tax=Striga asiatica TaxID=4170 RepID=A0A5A7QJB5_STRAF|nr:UDP-Glycosyltransferase superfamily protein [Striga asiatica]
MTTQEKQPHFVLLPFLAQGHMIPMVDISRLLAKRGVTVTILTSPNNHNRIKPTIDRAVASGSSIRVSHFKFPSTEAGLPEGFDNMEKVASMDESFKFMTAAAMLEDPVEQILKNLEPRPTCLIADMCFAWATAVATRFGIPRLVFHGTSCFALVCMHVLFLSRDFEKIAPSDTEYFVVPDLPDRIEVTKAQMRGTQKELTPEWVKVRDQLLGAESGAFGTVVNTFEELEPEYVRKYSELKGNKKVWCIGPVSSCNETDLDKAQRGSSIDEHHECLRWLGSRDPGSVIFVCLGTVARLAASQLVELGLGLEASNRPFVWVVRSAPDEFDTWLREENFEERVREKGIVIRGWAPQVLILSHPSVGGFLTHCGWNSTLEGMTAGLPMLTWPVLGEQFSNEKFVVSVAKIGVRVGLEVPVMFGEEERIGVQVKWEVVKGAIEELMDGGEEGQRRRERARELGKMAKRAIEEGGSSYLNMTRLITDVVKEVDGCGDGVGEGISVVLRKMSYSNVMYNTSMPPKNKHTNKPKPKSRAERNDIVSPSRAGKRARLVIIRIAISLRALALEHLRIASRLARIGRPVSSRAAVLRLVQRHTSTLAPNNPTVRTSDRQLVRAAGIDVCRAGHGRAAAPSNRDRQVEAVDKANVVKVLPPVAAQRELDEGGRWGAARPVALDPARPAVTGQAGAARATGAGPDAAGPRGRDVEGSGGVGGKLESGEGGRASSGEGGRPDLVGAVVLDGECGGVDASGGGGSCKMSWYNVPNRQLIRAAVVADVNRAGHSRAVCPADRNRQIIPIDQADSFPPSPPSVNSTREAGGAAPAWRHSTWPDPQSALRQVNLSAYEHSNRAQNLPDHGEAMSRGFVAWEGSSKPVRDCGPDPVRVAGQIV